MVKLLQKERKERLIAAKKKEEYWALYRECNYIMEGNRKKWLERREAEHLRRLEEEKNVRLKVSRAKQAKAKAKARLKAEKAGKDGKAGNEEYKEDYSRRQEGKKKLKGIQMMKSNLWKQRREKDGHLVAVWKTVQTNEVMDTKNSNPDKTSLVEDGDDKWLEEITLTDMERRKLEELERCHIEMVRTTPSTNDVILPLGIIVQPSGRPNQ